MYVTVMAKPGAAGWRAAATPCLEPQFPILDEDSSRIFEEEDKWLSHALCSFK